jgi:hypothetical protein
MPSDSPPSPDDRAQHEAERLPLAQQIVEIKSAQSLSWTEMGKQVGVAFQTLQAWASGTYAGRIDRVNADVRKYLDALQKREALVLEMLPDPGFVPTEAANAFQAMFRQGMAIKGVVTVIGAPGVGKTTAAKHFAATTPNVVMLNCLAGFASPAWLIGELCRVLRLSERGQSPRAVPAIIDRLTGKSAMVIVDEANHLRSDAIDLLRGICEHADCGLALVGNERVISLIEGTRQSDFAQLHSRQKGRLRIDKPTRGDVDRLLAAWGVQDDQVAKLLRQAAASAAGGALRRMITTLQLAHMLAASKRETLSAEHVSAADLSLRA